MHRIQIRQNKKCRQSLLPFPPSNLPLKKRTFRRPRDPDGLSEPRMLQGRVPPQNGARRIWSGRGARRHWTSGARSYGTWRHYGALKQATQPRFSSFRCQLNLSGGAFAGKKAFFNTQFTFPLYFVTRGNRESSIQSLIWNIKFWNIEIEVDPLGFYDVKWMQKLSHSS